MCFLYDRVLGSAGLMESDVDLELIPGFSETVAALETGRIDGAVVAEPWASLAVSRGTAFVWKRFAEISPSTELNLQVFSDGFATRRADVARRFMVARLRAVRDYDAGFFENRDRDALVSILTRTIPISDPAVYQRMSFSEMDPDGKVDVSSLEEQQDWYAVHGYVPVRADVKAALDSSFATYAVGVLGGYR